MCFEPGSGPPIAPIAGGAVDGRRIELTSGDYTPFAGFLARAERPTGAAMLVLPDVRGLHAYYEELALRLAEAGVDALAIDYFGRTAGTDDRPADFPFREHVEQTAYANLLLDLDAAARRLREEARPERVFSVGFCYGGRLAFLSAARPELDLAGAIGFYGVVSGPGRAGMPAPVDLADEMRCPVLGLFGGADESIPAETIAAFDAALGQAGVAHELVTYAEAPHSFFDRKAAQYADESADAWRRVLEFVSRPD
ncbi:MAG TPA: dienelactone hydrolase family protein [Candidatus Limnocylindrales bacterium]|nr:dienelactone hydrolase family protein [Candidatus Limnocylindrales bacterium]